MKKDITLIIDGPNLINRIIELEIDKIYIVDQLSLSELRASVNTQLENLGYDYYCNVIEFICSQKVFGSGNNRFSQEERNLLINRFKKEKGVYVEEINLPGSAEKGVDMTVGQRVQEYANQDEAVILISADRDYVPLLYKLRRERKKVLTVSFNDDFPIELQNESYQTLDLRSNFRDFFIYNYPYYNINTIKLYEFKNMIANADDRKNNQLRVDESGEVYISHLNVGAKDISDLRFRWETYGAYNGYVGPKIASDSDYMEEEYKALKKDWQHGRKGYVDYKI